MKAKRTSAKRAAKPRAAGLVKRAPSTKDARVELRAERASKQLIERAATLTGEPLSVFIIQAATARAREVIKEHEALVLSDRDRDALLELLDGKPKTPSPALVAAMERHKEIVRTSS